MTIQVGEKVPQGAFGVMGPEGPTQLSSEDLFAGKKVVLFAVPGSFYAHLLCRSSSGLCCYTTS